MRHHICREQFLNGFRGELKIRGRESPVGKRRIFKDFSVSDHPHNTAIYRLVSLRDSEFYGPQIR